MSRRNSPIPQKTFNFMPEGFQAAVIFDHGVIVVLFDLIIGAIAERIPADAGSAYQQGMAVRAKRLPETLNFFRFPYVEEHQLLVTVQEFSCLPKAVLDRKSVV